MTTTRAFTRVLTTAILLLQLLKEVSSFAPSTTRRTTIINVQQQQHQKKNPSLALHTNSILLPSASPSSSSFRLYSAAAGDNQHLRNLENNCVNGAKNQPTSIILLSTNQGIGFGCLLAWTSGMINGATLLGMFSSVGSQGTAALTGTYTKSALFLAQGDFATCRYYAKCFLTWAAGSTLVGWLIPEASAFQVKYPRGLAASLAIGAASLAYAANTAANKSSFVLWCLLANGIQDAISSVMTGNLCRTTHLTGMTCDMGTYLGQMVRRGTSKDVNKVRLRAFFFLTLSFWTGAFMSYPMATIFGSKMLLAVAGAYLSIAASIGIYFLRQRLGW